jgi:hypothetical protein
MKTPSTALLRLATTVALAATVLASTNCTTTYDAYGRPQQSVDPGVAIAGVAAAGLLGYALADGHDNHHHGYNHGYPRPYYPRRY